MSAPTTDEHAEEGEREDAPRGPPRRRDPGPRGGERQERSGEVEELRPVVPSGEEPASDARAFGLGGPTHLSGGLGRGGLLGRLGGLGRFRSLSSAFFLAAASAMRMLRVPRDPCP